MCCRNEYNRDAILGLVVIGLSVFSITIGMYSFIYAGIINQNQGVLIWSTLGQVLALVVLGLRVLFFKSIVEEPSSRGKSLVSVFICYSFASSLFSI